jgi:hypothetical protein
VCDRFEVAVRCARRWWRFLGHTERCVTDADRLSRRSRQLEGASLNDWLSGKACAVVLVRGRLGVTPSRRAGE